MTVALTASYFVGSLTLVVVSTRLIDVPIGVPDRALIVTVRSWVTPGANGQLGCGVGRTSTGGPDGGLLERGGGRGIGAPVWR